MYLEHFGFKEPPFSLTPDTHFWFDNPSHQEALNVLTMALRSGEGFVKVTGEVGLGKTMLCRKLLNSLGEGFTTAYIPNPHLSPASMRVAFAEELGLEVGGTKTQEQLLRTIAHRLLELARAGQRVVLCLDEAQELPDQTLEAVRLLTNLETEKFKLLQVVLFGQPELERRLAQPHLRQLRQRITFSYELKTLSRDATERYVNHRLRVAGYRGAPLFAPAALDAIYKAADGTPRLVNILCHKALLAAFGPGANQVVRVHARAAIEDTVHADGSVRRGWARAAGYATSFALLAAAAYALAHSVAGIIA